MRVDQLYGTLAYYRVVRKCLCTLHKIAEADWELLIEVASLDYFTRKDLDEGALISSWTRNRLADFVKKGYIKQIYRHSGRRGDHSKYQVELAWRMKIQTMYRIVFGDELLPEMQFERLKKTTRNKHLLRRVKRFNKIKKKL